jgi:hypothetical protein
MKQKHCHICGKPPHKSSHIEACGHVLCSVECFLTYSALEGAKHDAARRKDIARRAFAADRLAITAITCAFIVALGYIAADAIRMHYGQ